MLGGVATPYTDVLIGNFKALRSRAGLDHARLAARMRNLGYAWNRATVSKVERQVRVLKADEVLALAICLETSVRRLMSPLLEDSRVELPSGLPLRVTAVEGYVTGEWVTDARILWHEDRPLVNPLPEGDS
jgi:transcriptional regulator with XRE-family HTH domain